MKHGYWNKNKKIKHWTQACKKLNQTMEGWAENYITRWSVGNDVIHVYNRYASLSWIYKFTEQLIFKSSEQRIKLLIWNIKPVGWNKIL